MNLGMCGGFAGSIEVGDLILVEETLVYDVVNQMTDVQEVIEHYLTRLNLALLKSKGPIPLPMRRGRLVSAAVHR
jgi:nucleoside phosphorylase